VVGNLPRCCDSGKGWSPVNDKGDLHGSKQSALLAAIEAGLLVFFHDDVNFGAEHQSCRCNASKWITTTPQKWILSLTYLSLVLSLAVTVTSYSLIAEFSILPSRVARDPLHTYSPSETIKGSNWDILRHYCLRSWVFYVWKFCMHSIKSGCFYTLMRFL
jgi:hypothetical protein